MKTQKFKVEITDKTGQFPIDAKRLEKVLNNNLSISHVVSVVEVKE